MDDLNGDLPLPPTVQVRPLVYALVSILIDMQHRRPHSNLVARGDASHARALVSMHTVQAFMRLCLYAYAPQGMRT